MENKCYIASKGMVYRRKSDNVIVGRYIRLKESTDDYIYTIDNYEEVVDERYQKMRELIDKRITEVKESINKRIDKEEMEKRRSEIKIEIEKYKVRNKNIENKTDNIDVSNNI